MNKLKVPVEEFTTPDPVTSIEEASLEKLGQIMSEFGVRHIPIVRGDSVVGIVSDRDLRVVSCLSAQEKKLLRASDIMVADPVTVSANSSLEEVAFQMSEKKIGSVIVNDDSDNLLGIFTVTDALNALIEIARTSQVGR